MGRFINADGIAGATGDLLSHNMFAYCKNNPVNKFDPSGYFEATINGLHDGGDIDLSGGLVAVIYTTIMLISNTSTSPVIKPVSLSDSKSVTTGMTEIDIQPMPHGNSKRSVKLQHGYEIYNIVDGDIVKCGISGGKIRLDGKSYRAEKQVRAFNNNPLDGNIYASRIVAFFPDRLSALAWEWANTQHLYFQRNSMRYHIFPMFDYEDYMN